MSLESLVSWAGLVAALSEGQRQIAHLVVVLAVIAALAVVGLVRLMRRKARRRNETHETERAADEP
jgi:uncharacterized membrane protein